MIKLLKIEPKNQSSINKAKAARIAGLKKEKESTEMKLENEEEDLQKISELESGTNGETMEKDNASTEEGLEETELKENESDVVVEPALKYKKSKLVEDKEEQEKKV